MAGMIERRRVLEKGHEGSVPGHLVFTDFYNRPGWISAKLARLVEARVLVPGDKGKLKIPLVPVADVSPWYHVRQPTNRQCSLYHEVYFRNFEFIPQRCLRCWKIVFSTHKDPAMQKVSELFELRDWIQGQNMPSKCGVDMRLYTSTRYVGFTYAESVEEGRVYYGIIKRKLSEIFPECSVILKRGCTEFEHKFGDSNLWDQRYAEGWGSLEEYLDFMIEYSDEPKLEGLLTHADADTFRFWIEYAQAIGDHSWRKALEAQGYTVPEDLFFKPITYHEE